MKESFSANVLRWGAQHGRKGLPWQEPLDPYRVWISEIMLQQTRVETVIPYFHRFIETFPDICALAAAGQDQVLGLWSGLGYYARARNLHKAAITLCERYGGEMPPSREALEALPGIGRSTAAAILSIGFDLPEPILDGNVKRVLCRYHGVEGWPGRSAVVRQLWRHAEQHMPQQQCGLYTQAMMDLGASLCSRHQPACGECPVAGGCVACKEGRADELPQPKPGKKLPQRSCSMAILHNGGGALWMERRPEQGIWGGLWSFPEMASVAEWKELQKPQTWPVLRHTFTHFKLEITPLYCELDQPVYTAPQGEWVTLDALEQRGIAAPVRRLIEYMRAEQLL